MGSKVFFNDKNIAKFVCPKCEYTKHFNILKFKDSKKTDVTCKCICGFVYTVTLAGKKETKRDTFLPGKYVFCDGRGQGDIIVTNLSDNGLSFEIGQENQIRKNDIFFIEFRLDNRAQSLVTKEVIVQKVQGTSVGAEFY